MKRPNIILISIDTLRQDHVSCYGYYKTTTPNIDRLASEGTIYKNNFSTGVWTPPGHASMLTGLYVSEHGVYGERRLSDDIPTIATILKENGYQTAGFVNNSQVGALVGFDKGHDTFVEVWKGISSRSKVERYFKGAIRQVKKRLGYEDMGASRTNELVKEWILNTIDPNRPFYLFIHYIEPHNPLIPPQPYKDRYLSDKRFIDVDRDKIKKVAHNPLICFTEMITLNPVEIDILKALYDAEIEYTDSKIGEIMNVLKEKDIYDNSMIMITSDHGEHFGEHNLWSHTASLYNEILHIPLIIKYPKGIECKKEVYHYTQSIDIFPTVMDIVSISKKEVMDHSGVSLVHNNNGNKFHDFVFAEWEGRIPYFVQTRLKDPQSSLNAGRFTNKMWTIIGEQYKYILTSDGKEELYNVKKDKSEIDNLIDQNQEDADMMKKKLERWMSEAKRNSDNDRRVVDDEVRKNLEGLGYL